jgi:hypothetical protein
VLSMVVARAASAIFFILFSSTERASGFAPVFRMFPIGK